MSLFPKSSTPGLDCWLEPLLKLINTREGFWEGKVAQRPQYSHCPWLSHCTAVNSCRGKQNWKSAGRENNLVKQLCLRGLRFYHKLVVCGRTIEAELEAAKSIPHVLESPLNQLSISLSSLQSQTGEQGWWLSLPCAPLNYGLQVSCTAYSVLENLLLPFHIWSSFFNIFCQRLPVQPHEPQITTDAFDSCRCHLKKNIQDLDSIIKMITSPFTLGVLK